MNDLRRRAIGLLARREHSRAELARKLTAEGTAEEIDTVLAQLEVEGLLSDARFAEVYVRSHAERFGGAKLRQTLRARGVHEDLFQAQLVALPDELARARAIWSKKFGSAPADRREWARQARFLQNRGFAPDVVVRLLKEPGE